MKIVSAHDASIPVLGFGTWELSGKACVRSVAEAIRTGYRHIDTAAAYGNEDRVGEGIRAAGIARKEVFITTKCGPPDLDDASFKSSIERSLKLLGVDQVDLVLIHSPDKALGVAEQIATLNAVKRNGWTRHIGVSNFTTRLLSEAWATTREPLVTNQCEYHPYLNQDKLIAACRDAGMIFTAYAPLGLRVVLDDPVIFEVAKRKGRAPAQVVLRWNIQQDGIATIPRSANSDHIRSNFDIFGFSLDEDEMAAISALSRTCRRRLYTNARWSLTSADLNRCSS